MTDAFKHRTWEELEIVSHESGRLMFPGEIRKRDESGRVVATKVLVWVPVPNDNIQARVDMRVWAHSKKHLDPDRDKDLLEQMESICLLARAIRTKEAPHAQFCDYDELADYEEASLKVIQEQINQLKVLTDPRMTIADEDTFWKVVTDIAAKGHLLPLADIAGHEQPSLVLRMALEACRSPTAPSFAQLPATSTPGT